MRDSVRDAFYGFTVPFEGAVNYLYQDVLGLVSIGAGILADSVGIAVSLPLLRADGTPATMGEITAEWHAIKNLGAGPMATNPAAKGGHLYAKRFTTLHLDDAGLRSTLGVKLDLFDRQMKQRFDGYEDWCADAQLAILSHCWACGGAFRFPKLDAALRVKDFATAAVESRMNTVGNPGLVPRVKAERTLFMNASVVEAQQMDPEALYFPRDLEQEPPSAA